MESHLDIPQLALEAYLNSLTRQADLALAQRNLEAAQQFHARVNAPDWDPGGNTNNPGKVARALQEAAGSADRVQAAKQALQSATELRKELEEAPFDTAKWLAEHHPTLAP